MPMKPGTQVITFRISTELKEQIEKEAARQGRSVNNMIQHMVTIYLKTVQRKQLDISREE